MVCVKCSLKVMYSGASVNNHLRIKASCYITARHPRPSLCTKQPLNKGHLCIKAKTLFPNGVHYRGISLYMYMLYAFRFNTVTAHSTTDAHTQHSDKWQLHCRLYSCCRAPWSLCKTQTTYSALQTKPVLFSAPTPRST